jgi:hypothetical protein
MIIFEIVLPKCALDAYQQTCVEGLYAVGERQMPLQTVRQW